MRAMNMARFISITPIAVCGSFAQAGFVNPVSIDRHVVARRWPDEVRRDGIGVVPFTATVTTPDGLATASQNSTINEDTISISGSASGYGDSDIGCTAVSVLRESFILTSRTPYRFSIQWVFECEEYDSPGLEFRLHKTPYTGFIFKGNYGQPFQNSSWSSAGYLEPGQYVYHVQGSVFVYGGGGPAYPRMTFSATFSLIPEPATATLFALGGLGLIRRRLSYRQD